ncbi:RagB/SusD family nutrient uptake outer membrane protein [Phocaeicola sp.]|uniref:RagB/SusD family nutrient uptake outer membrane protein n=1 Tax=Phocaeicola sp. TaxID=2773926 RepID=UPI003A91092E
MKKVYRNIILILGSIFMSGCVDNLLDRNPIASLSPATFYQDENQCKMALMGVYSALQPVTSTYWFQLDFMSDDAYCQDAWQGSKEFGEWAQNSSSGAAYDRWTQDYKIIVRANTFMLDAKDAAIDETVKSQMMAEAKFLRAYAYADLITFFGDVPIVEESQTLENAYVSRSSKADVLKYLLDDLNAAKEVLPRQYSGSDVGRATKGAALALKCRILLYNEQWAEAASAAQEVIDLGVYDLYNDYAGLFEEANENNIEVIFDIQYH